jgi:hypothetical protein
VLAATASLAHSDDKLPSTCCCCCSVFNKWHTVDETHYFGCDSITRSSVIGQLLLLLLLLLLMMMLNL